MTVPNALAVYDAIRATGLRYVGFKDVGAPTEVLVELTRRIRDNGRIPVLEVVSISTADELRSIRTGLEIGVDLLMGGVHRKRQSPCWPAPGSATTRSRGRSSAIQASSPGRSTVSQRRRAR